MNYKHHAMTRQSFRRTGLLLLVAAATVVSCSEPIAPVTTESHGETIAPAQARARATTLNTFKVDAVTIETRFWDAAPFYVDPASTNYSTCDALGTCDVWNPALKSLVSTQPGSYFDGLARTNPLYTNTPLPVAGIGCATVTPWNQDTTGGFPSGSAMHYDLCLRNPGGPAGTSIYNVATRYRVRVSGGNTGGTFKIRFGVDFMGGVLLINGALTTSNWRDPAWGGYIDTPIYPGVPPLGTPWTYAALWTTDPTGGFEATITLNTNQTKIIDVIGFENGDDYGGMIQFAGPDGVWMDAESLNLQVPLNVRVAADSGRIVSPIVGLDCNATCATTAYWGTRPVLTAVPNQYFAFTRWGGACSGTGACEPQMDAVQSVTATFTRTQWPVSVSIAAGTGSGKVISTPAGIDCGTSCTSGFAVGSTVTLTAVPNPGSRTTAWTGCSSFTGNTCTITNLNAVKNVSVTFTQTATKLGLTTPVASASSGAPFVPQPVVAIQDETGATVTTSNAVVTMTARNASNAVVGTFTATAVNGVATFSGASISGLVGNYTLTFTSGTLTAVSQTIALTAGVPAKLALTRPAAGAKSGAAFVTQPIVTVQDAAGNTVTSYSGSVTMAASIGATIVGTASAMAVNGVATFGDVGLSGLAGNYTLTYAAGSLPAVTQTIALAAGAASQMALLAGDGQTAVVGGTVAIAPSVIVKDASGNPVAGVTVTFQTVLGGGTAIGGFTQTSAAGVAAVGGWQMGLTPGLNTMTAVSANLAGSPVTFSATAIPNTTPTDLACEADPKVLWPVNHKLVDIEVELPHRGSQWVLDSVTSNEPADAKGDGKTLSDIVGWTPGIRDTRGQLRAERAGDKQDRVYTIRYHGVDESNRPATATCRVVVPHDQDDKDDKNEKEKKDK